MKPFTDTTEYISQVDKTIHNLQIYNPLFHRILKDSNPDISLTEHNTLQAKYQFVDMSKVKRTQFPYTEYKTPIHIKYAPLLDPLRYMTGKYDLEPEMKKHKMMTLEAANTMENGECAPTKYQDVDNAAYVDAFFCYLNSRLLHDYQFIHCLDFYGVYLGIQDNFQMDIIEDFDYLSKFEEFHQKIKNGEIIIVEGDPQTECDDEDDDDADNESLRPKNQTRIAKNTLKLVDLENDFDLDIVTLQTEAVLDTTLNTLCEAETMTLEYDSKVEDVYESDSSLEENTDDESSCNDDSDYDDSIVSKKKEKKENSEDESTDDSSNYETITDESNESDDEDDKLIVHVKNFPVAMICLEKCEETLDHLFETGVLNNDSCQSIAFQIVITLTLYQRLFRFTHNDLHTHNIMYKKTDVEYLYYIFDGKKYAVPTFGRIIKIIDFGRSVYYLGDRKITSDGFSPNGDAHSQYNTEPYFNPKKKRVEENPSFDLCRLGCSIYDFVLDKDNLKDTNKQEKDSFQKLVENWCKDDRQKNVLYKSNGKERYPHFKLYKMIARAVHQHIPEQEIKEFDCFLVSEEEAQSHWPWMNVDEIVKNNFLESIIPIPVKNPGTTLI